MNLGPAAADLRIRVDIEASRPQHQEVSGQQRPPDVYRVLDEARAVRERVQRLLQALVYTAETVADAVEGDVFAHSQWAAEYEHLARTAREDADLYRELQQRLQARDG